MDEIKGTLCAARLVTLTGVGGCGKTRLAIEVAAGLQSKFADGVSFVDLAPVQESAAVAEGVALSLGLRQQMGGQLARIIGDTRLLLVMDNAEHLTEAVSALATELLAQCPRLAILITSREPLHLDGEVCCEVSPLAYPPEGARANVAEVASYEAVQLFTVRVAESWAGFALNGENAHLVSAICRQVNGIPLAIELAAARVRSLGLAQLAARLNDSLRLLTRGSRVGPARHRTLRATLDWSHQLLDEPGRILFRRLSVFAGFDVAAVEAICSGPELPEAEVSDVLHDLVDKSLVVAQPQNNGGLRYFQYDVVRQYAREKLLEAGETSGIAAFAEYYADLVRGLSAKKGDIPARAAQMSADYGNVQVAMDWASAARPDLEAEIVANLWWFWGFGGAVREARKRIDAVLAKNSVAGRMLAWLSLMAARWALQDGDRDRGLAELDRAEATASEIGDGYLIVLALNLRGVVQSLDHPVASELHFRRAIELASSAQPTDHHPNMGDTLSMLLNNLAMTLLVTGRAAEALMQVERAIEVMPEPEYPNMDIDSLHTRGAALLALNRAQEARDQFIASLRIAAGNRNHEPAIAALIGLACTASVFGQPSSCITFLGAARRWSQATDFKPYSSLVMPFEEAEHASWRVLDRRTAEAAANRGRTMDLDDALEFARATSSNRPNLPLAPRKLQVVRLVAEGLTNKQIAERLSISERTVDAHLELARKQLGLRNRAQVAAWVASGDLS